MITFYLVRHGQKEAVPFNPPLTKIGVKQAEATARRFNNLQLRTIISSQKLRTRQTAEIIAKQQSVTIDKRVQERLEWEHNQSFDEFMTEWNKTDIDRRYKPKKGNSSYDNGKQMKKIIDELSETYKSGNILIVSHGGSIGDLLRQLFTEKAIPHKTEPLSGAKHIEISECSITIIRKSKKLYNLLKLNDINHLSIPLT